METLKLSVWAESGTNTYWWKTKLTSTAKATDSLPTYSPHYALRPIYTKNPRKLQNLNHPRKWVSWFCNLAKCSLTRSPGRARVDGKRISQLADSIGLSKADWEYLTSLAVRVSAGPLTTVVSGPIWTNWVPNRKVIFFLKIVSYSQIRDSRYRLLNLKTSCTS